MVVLIALIGWLVGWLLYWAADFAPRLAADPSQQTKVPQTRGLSPLFNNHLPAVWQLARGPRSGAILLPLAIEAVSAAVFAYLWLRFGPSWNLLLTAASYAFLLLIAIIDLKFRLILNAFTYPAIVALLVYGVVWRQDALRVLLGGALAFAIFFLTAWLKPGDLGGGDVKLATLIGVAFGFPHVLWALIVGAGSGALVAVYLIARRKGLKSHIPYAPFLCLGALVALLYNPFLR